LSMTAKREDKQFLKTSFKKKEKKEQRWRRRNGMKKRGSGITEKSEYELWVVENFFARAEKLMPSGRD